MVDNELPKEEENEEKRKGDNEKTFAKVGCSGSDAIDLELTVVVEEEK